MDVLELDLRHRNAWLRGAINAVLEAHSRADGASTPLILQVREVAQRLQVGAWAYMDDGTYETLASAHRNLLERAQVIISAGAAPAERFIYPQ